MEDPADRVPPRWRGTWLSRLVLASVVSGAALGIAARVAMRLVAIEAGLPGSVSFGGSLEVVLFGVLLGSPLAALFFVARGRLAMRGPGPGLVYGLAVYALLVAVPPPAARSALAATPDTGVVTALVFGVVFAAWGIGLDAVASKLVRTLAAS